MNTPSEESDRELVAKTLWSYARGLIPDAALAYRGHEIAAFVLFVLRERGWMKGEEDWDRLQKIRLHVEAERDALSEQLRSLRADYEDKVVAANVRALQAECQRITEERDALRAERDEAVQEREFLRAKATGAFASAALLVKKSNEVCDKRDAAFTQAHATAIARAEAAEKHIASTRAMLQIECDDAGCECPEKLHLADVIEKYLCRALHARVEAAENRLNEMTLKHEAKCAQSLAIDLEKSALTAKLAAAQAEAGRMRDLLASLRQDIPHHNCFSEMCQACEIDAALSPGDAGTA